MAIPKPPFPAAWRSIPISPRNLTLANTLPVGQSFLWHRLPQTAEQDEEYSRAIDDPPRVVCLRQSPTHIHYTAVYPNADAAERDEHMSATKLWLEDYFQLATYPDLDVLYADWRDRDPKLFAPAELNPRAIGVRVLRQDPWECLVAFITSTNNHISRITSLLHKLSKTFTDPVLTLDHSPHSPPITYHLFPAPHLLPVALDTTLRDLGFGYRAPFIESSLATLRHKFGSQKGDIEAELALWRHRDTETVRDELVALKGVGRKVADCVMLMCLDKPSLVPIDTHVANIAARHPSFPSRLRGKPMSKQVYDETQEFLLDKWGPLAGLCQAVMFAADLAPAPMVKKEVVSVAKQTTKTRRIEVVEDSEKQPPLKRTRSATRQAIKVEVSTTKQELP
ncbi:hypothetical protein B9479_002142 [Cryptococcus floricola]|uniref:DNA-(apurinic or apyrimidinic site) lyase n=1 Tax=Cryptococcus floricola TaxID=2591691 RepID=A0A5D3B0G1_9TREE|nr:hypothetical protein B9479_002142 [Cryptococcus floricola]